MVSNSAVRESCGRGDARWGFLIVRSTLFLNVVLRIAKLVFDKYSSTPSVHTIVDEVMHPEVAGILKNEYVDGYCAVDSSSDRSLHEGEFDSHLNELRSLAQEVKADPLFLCAKKVRDKSIAHWEVVYRNGKYELYDISQHDLKWTSPRDMIERLRPVIDKVNLVVRGASFGWESLKSGSEGIADGYWAAACAAGQHDAAP